MYTVDEIVMDAPLDICFQAAADVEGWPEALPHYRWVHFQQREAFGTGRVEMAARRHFGPLPYPVWWVSDMRLDQQAPAVLYRHVDGITTGMEVIWSFREVEGERTHVKIVHDWDGGPAWPLPRFLRKWIADLVIGPVFIHHVASRTLKGIRGKAEKINAERGRVSK
jgi:ribosome-associated toxin RatA of RatAB toxin-antitoxin module